MGELNLNNAVASDLSNQITDYSVDEKSLDSVQGQNETRWKVKDWEKWLGYFKTIPEINAAINAKATWTIGKGYLASPVTDQTLKFIKGNGKDTFNTILENQIRTYYICGDSFCEVIRKEDNSFINLKPISPAKMTIIYDKSGMIKNYEQDTAKGKPIKFRIEEIFHLSRNRLGDEMHGGGVIEPVEAIILARNEAISDYKEMMHRYMKPRYIFHLDTDDPIKIATFKASADKAWADGENIYVPKDAVVPEQMSIAPNSTLDPKAWIKAQGNYFYEAVGTPQIIIGGSSEFTEASAKIAYLAWQQNIEEEQLYIEEQCGIQLGIKLNLEFPASLENELLSDNKKDGAENIDESETTAGVGQ